LCALWVFCVMGFVNVVLLILNESTVCLLMPSWS
jgi:hypothetical protein